MAVWRCSLCGFEQENRCKPRKCPNCGGKDSFGKKEAEGGTKTTKKKAI